MNPALTTEAQENHRRAAAESNNRAWDLSVRARTPEEDCEMLDAAHAAAWHWGKIGTELHHKRALMLLAEVHALLGYGPTALAYARDMHTYFLGRAETPDWEIAFAHAILAHAAAASGEPETHRRAYRDAEAALTAITNPQDRKPVEETFAHVPRPD